MRWLQRKRETVENKIGRTPSHEEIILEYKGLLKSKSDYMKAGLKKYRTHYNELKK